MKRLFTLLLTLATLITLASCGNGIDVSEDGNKAQNSNVSDLNENVNWDEVEDAFEILESLKPEGWDENSYGAYIYDVYDSDALPDCIPKQIDGTLAYMTSIKDYSHKVLNDNFRVGPIYYENYEDYREYSVSFYANHDHLSAFISELESKGMKGYMEGEEDSFGSGDWWEGFYGNGEWVISLFYNTNDDKDGQFGGCLSISATNDLYKLPKSIAGITLPQVGVVTFDHEIGYTIQDFSEGYDDVDFDIAKDSFPNEYFAAWVDYYCVSRQDAIDYVAVLENEGWTLEYSYRDEENAYSKVLKKDGIFAYVNYEDSYLQIGFSDMVENLTY